MPRQKFRSSSEREWNLSFVTNINQITKHIFKRCPITKILKNPNSKKKSYITVEAEPFWNYVDKRNSKALDISVTKHHCDERKFLSRHLSVLSIIYE